MSFAFQDLLEVRRNQSIVDRDTPAAGGGIFTPKSRKRLLGILGLTGRERTKNDFWYDQRRRVEHALKDLEIFIEMAGDSNVNQVLTRETLEPIVEALLWNPVVQKDNPDINKAEIAQLFVRKGLAYLQAMKSEHITIPHRNAISGALDLCNYLVETFKPEAERRTRSSQPR